MINLELYNVHLERTLFRIISAVAALYEVYGISIGFIYGYSTISFIVDSFLFLAFCGFFVLSYRLKNPEKILQFPLILIVYLGILFFWFQSGGLWGGSIGFIASGAMLIMVLVPSSPYYFFTSIGFFLTEAILVSVEILRPELFNMEGISRGLPSLPSTFLIINFFSGGLIVFLKALYDRERKALQASKRLLEEKNDVIATRNQELLEQKQATEHVNFSLEEKVRERTQKIHNQKKQFEEYTYLNVHKLRGAISRIMGLSTLLKEDTGNKENLRDLIDESAKEADQVLKEITHKISEESES